MLSGISKIHLPIVANLNSNFKGSDGITTIDDMLHKSTVKKTGMSIIRYNKKDCKELQFIGDKKNQMMVESAYFVRSIVTDPDGKMVCFSQPKTNGIVDDFTKAWSAYATAFKSMRCDESDGDSTDIAFCDPAVPSCYINEKVEGTMVNVFHDGKKWEMATKGFIGAGNKFFMHKPLSFRDMVINALGIMNDGKGVEFDDVLDKQYCYSFVVQHPENRIINYVETPTLYLVGLYSIYEDEYVLKPFRKQVKKFFNKNYSVIKHDIYYGSTDVMSHIGELMSVGFKRPTLYYDYLFMAQNILKSDDLSGTFDPESVIEHALTECLIDEKQIPAGFFIHTSFGVYKYVDPEYKEMLELRGNQSKIKYHFLELRKERKVDDYLELFPEDAEMFDEFEEEVREYTSDLYSLYLDCFKHKKGHIKEYDGKFRKNMCALHDKYLKTIRFYKRHQRPNWVTKRDAIYHVNTLHPSQLMFSLNFHMNPHFHKDTKATAQAGDGSGHTSDSE